MKQEIIEIIKNTGLNEAEAQVYSVLIELGQARITDIALRAEQKRPTTYAAIDRLELLGLVSKSKSGKRFLYGAIHPRRLKQMMQTRLSRLNEVYPKLENTYYNSKEKPEVQVLEGIENIKESYSHIFSMVAAGEEGLFFGNIDAANEQYQELLKDYLQNLLNIEKPKVRDMVLKSEDARKWGLSVKKRSTSNTHKVRLLPHDNSFGQTDFMLVGKELYIFSFSREIFVTMIKSKEIAKTYRSMFDILWSQAEEL